MAYRLNPAPGRTNRRNDETRAGDVSRRLLLPFNDSKDTKRENSLSTKIGQQERHSEDTGDEDFHLLQLRGEAGGVKLRQSRA